MLALGEPTYEPFRYQPLPQLPSSSWTEARRTPGATCQAQDDADDLAGDATYFVTPGQAQSLGGFGNSALWKFVEAQGVVKPARLELTRRLPITVPEALRIRSESNHDSRTRASSLAKRIAYHESGHAVTALTHGLVLR